MFDFGHQTLGRLPVPDRNPTAAPTPDRIPIPGIEPKVFTRQGMAFEFR